MDLEDFAIAETGDEPVAVYNLPESEEAQAFEASFKFYEGTHHDHLPMRWNGTSCNTGDSFLRDRYLAHGLVPIDIGRPESRRPDMPTPTAQVIVHRNTGLMFGSPVELDMIADDDSQELLREIYRYGDLHVQLSEGRNYAGGGGNAVEIPQVIGGKPALRVYKPSEFKVLRWSDKEQWQPARIVRQVLLPLQCRDRQGKLRTELFWCTTEWDDKNVIEYQPVPRGWDKPIPPKAGGVRPHGASRCPVTWYANTPSDGPWGKTDFCGLEPRCDVIDRLGSHVQSAIGQNCDATVFHADDEGTRRRNQIKRRGRGQVWQGSEKANFGLVETSAQGLERAEIFWRGVMHDTFELADVVRVTAETAGSLKAAEAIRLLWRASEVRVGKLWPQRAGTMRRIMESFYEMAETFGVSSIEAPKKNTLILPSRKLPCEPPEVEAAEHVAPPAPPVAGDDAEKPAAPVPPPAFKPKPRPEKPEIKLAPHKVGKFGYISLKLGPYFEKSALERKDEIVTLGTAAGGGKLLSLETARTLAARTYDVDPDDELRRLHEEDEAGEAKAYDMMTAMQSNGLADADEEAEEDAEDEAGRKDSKPAEDDSEDEDEEDDESEAAE